MVREERPRKSRRSGRSQKTWADQLKAVLDKLREGAKGYNAAEVEAIIDEAVAAVRRAEFLASRREREPVFQVEPRAVKVTFSAKSFSVFLADRRMLTVPLDFFPRLLAAKPGQRRSCEFSGGGTGIHWPELDEDISVAGLLLRVPDLTQRKLTPAERFNKLAAETRRRFRESEITPEDVEDATRWARRTNASTHSAGSSPNTKSPGRPRSHGEDRTLVRAAAKLSEDTFRAIWDNENDAAYDRSARVRFMSDVDEGLAQLERGKGIPHHQVKKRLLECPRPAARKEIRTESHRNARELQTRKGKT